ncbi:MAG: hypothetical protein JSU04_12620 [Bdellovibrionales bacterium]|nr:hypothetical protein [Bdellovibrionales bacterium]
MMKALIAILLSASVSHAGGDWYEKGNGGFIISCPNKPTQLLDLYELQYRFRDISGLHNMSLDTTEFKTLDDRFHYLLKKISRLNPNRSSLYEGWYEDFKQEAEFLPGIHLNPIGDVGLVTPEPDCDLRQVVFQRDPSILSPHRYTIDLDSWNSLTVIDQAALLIHEFSYREFAQPPNSHATSESARYFNALVNSQELINMSTSQYLRTLQMLNVVRADYLSNPVLLAVKDRTTSTWYHFPLKFDSDDNLASITYESSATLVQADVTIFSTCSTSNNDLLAMGVAYYNPQGLIMNLSEVPDGIPGYNRCMVNIDTKRQFLARAHNLNFNFDGNLRISSGTFKISNYGFFSYPLVLKNHNFIIGSDSIKNVQISVQYDANHDIEFIDYWGKACRNPSTSDVVLSNWDATKTPSTFSGQNLEQEILALSACQN